MRRTIFLFAVAFSAAPARADLFGGDDILLGEIVSNTLEQLVQLRQMLSTAQDTFGYLQQVNQGVSEALSLGQTMNQTLNSGALSNLQDVNSALGKVQQLYGLIPRTHEADLQRTTDQTVAEGIDLHNQAYRYADQVDPAAEAIKEQAKIVSPQGAGRLTAESVGVLIHVMNQVLRTNAAMVQLQSQQLALQNRHEKLSSEQFLVQYSGLAAAFGGLKSDYDLAPLTPNP